MGGHQAAARAYNFGFRGRMDERYDLMRTMRDQRYVYIRNYCPHKIYGQYVTYMWGTKTTEITAERSDALVEIPRFADRRRILPR